MGVFETLPTSLEDDMSGVGKANGGIIQIDKWGVLQKLRVTQFYFTKTSRFMFCAKEDEYPTAEDLWRSVIMTSKERIHIIASPTKEMTAFYKLCWEL